MAIFGKSGVTNKTPGNIVFGAGTIHKGLKYTVEPFLPGMTCLT